MAFLALSKGRMMYNICLVASLVSCLSCQPLVVVDPRDPFVKDTTIVLCDDIEYQLTRQCPVEITRGEQSVLYDFGRAAFARPELTITSTNKDSLFFSIGECLKDNHIDPSPGQFRRYRRIGIELKEGTHKYKIIISRDPYGSTISGFSIPKEVGEVTPFRYLEIEGYSVSDCSVSRIMLTCPFDDDASSFRCDNQALNEVWDFCKYSIKATSFAGYYVDGDRERKPYEADALINQLGHYAVDSYYVMARRTCKYLLDNPTWPTEWILQTILIAWNDYLFTGDDSLIRERYDQLKLHALFDLIDPGTALLTTSKGQTSSFLASLGLKYEMRDIVDWPHAEDEGALGEDDGFVYSDYNTVVNAFHYQAVKTLSKISFALGYNSEGKKYLDYSERFKRVFNDAFFDVERGVYTDGLEESHASLHANMFPLAFDMVPDEWKLEVTQFLCSRGMACSVYGSQFLMEALYNAGRSDVALNYMTSESKRSWRNMIREGSTISMEAWGNEFKPDQDWNHAWGAAPANIIPFRLVGVFPIEPGFSLIGIRPQLGGLSYVNAMIPSPKGDISVEVTHNCITCDLPVGVSAELSFPIPKYQYLIKVNGRTVKTFEDRGFVYLSDYVKGSCRLTMEPIPL